MFAPPPNRKTKFTLSVLQCLCQPTKCSPGNFKMQTLKKNTPNWNGTGLTECLSQPRIALQDLGSLPWAVPSWHCPLKYSNPCVHHSETANSATPKHECGAHAQPTCTQTCQPAPSMAAWLPSGSQVKPAHVPDSFDSVPPAVAERAIHRDGSNAAAQIVAIIKNIGMLLPSLKGLYACKAAQAFLLPFGLDFGATSGVIWSPSSSALILQSQSHGQAKLPESEWVPSPPSRGSKKRACMAILPRSRELWRAVIYRPLAQWEIAVGSCKHG